jgi:hypothetical protein
LTTSAAPGGTYCPRTTFAGRSSRPAVPARSPLTARLRRRRG